jgi:magnesium-transporting ATPase (P-type)
MLTGDKGETAETIGISCGLIDDKKQKIYKIDTVEKE